MNNTWLQIVHSLCYMYQKSRQADQPQESFEKLSQTESGIWYEHPLFLNPRFFQTHAQVFDVYCDPLNDIVELWTLEDHMVTVFRQNKPNYHFSVSENKRIHVLDRNTCIVVGDKNMVYRNGILQHEYRRSVTKTCFLYDINKYMIQNERDIVILNQLDDSDPMVFTNYGSPIAFYGHQRILLYINRSYLCVAETGFPYRIVIKQIPKLYYSAIHCASTHIVLVSEYYNVFLSMFPMSFTASTRMLTTFE